MEQLRDDGVISGWRGEEYPVSASFYEDPVFVMERAAVPLLGAIEYGVHVNGLVKSTDKDVKMWIARRSQSKSKYPGMLDHIVAGGQPAGLSLMENVVKECMEEAGIPEDLIRAGIRPAGASSYETYSSGKRTLPAGISRAVLFNYDLYLPPDFVPKPLDGEVEEFFLWSIDEILQSMSKDYPDPIKPNCYSVIIDYLLREGHLSPEVPGYLDVLRELRNGNCR
jgi:isopentenyldiphosphate isomerase